MIVQGFLTLGDEFVRPIETAFDALVHLLAVDEELLVLIQIEEEAFLVSGAAAVGLAVQVCMRGLRREIGEGVLVAVVVVVVD